MKYRVEKLTGYGWLIMSQHDNYESARVDLRNRGVAYGRIVPQSTPYDSEISKMYPKRRK